MIVAAILAVGVYLLAFIVSFFPDVPVPGWLSVDGVTGTVFQAASSMGVWFPGGLAITIILSVFAIKVVGLAIKIARMVLSLMTGGGGSAV